MQLIGAADLIPSEYRTLLAGMNLDLSLLSSVIPSELRAPASGTVTFLSLVPGGAALPSSSVCTVSQTDQLRLKMLVGETEADQVEEGDLVVFQADVRKNIRERCRRFFRQPAKHWLVPPSRRLLALMWRSTGRIPA